MRKHLMMSALLVATVRVIVISALLTTAVIRSIVLVPSVVSASGKLRAPEIAVVGKGRDAEETKECETMRVLRFMTGKERLCYKTSYFEVCWYFIVPEVTLSI